MGNLVFQATLGGQVNLVGPNTASTFNLNVPAVSATLATTDANTFTAAQTISSGNLVFSGTGQKVTGDYSNATVSSRQAFQSSTTNGSTGIYALPNGTSTAASWQATNAADPTNASKILIATNGSTDVQLVSGINGTGTYLPLSFYTNGAEKMRLDTSGNLGLGVTPSAWGASALKAIQLGGGSLALSSSGAGAGDGSLTWNGYYNGTNWIYAYTGGASNRFRLNESGAAWFQATSGTAGGTISYTQAMTLDASGNLLVGSTSAAWTGGGGAAIQCKGITSHAGQSGAFQNNGINLEWRSGALRVWVDTTDLGTVQFASDYRLKKDVQTQTTPALDRIAQVRPVTFEFGDYGDLFKADGVAREGFIAHELAAVIPSAVDGEKDCENQIQTLRLDALCSVMVKAIQEQQAIIQQLQADVANVRSELTALKGQA